MGNFSLLQDRHRLLQMLGRHGNDDARLRFVEENLIDTQIVRTKIDIGAVETSGIETAFAECDGQAAFAAIVGTLHQALANQMPDGFLDIDFTHKIDMRRRTFLTAVANLEKTRSAEFGSDFTDQNDSVADFLKPLRRALPFLIDQAH